MKFIFWCKKSHWTVFRSIFVYDQVSIELIRKCRRKKSCIENACYAKNELMDSDGENANVIEFVWVAWSVSEEYFSVVIIFGPCPPRIPIRARSPPTLLPNALLLTIIDNGNNIKQLKVQTHSHTQTPRTIYQTVKLGFGLFICKMNLNPLGCQPIKVLRKLLTLFIWPAL